jgi:hypothetical protein
VDQRESGLKGIDVPDSFAALEQTQVEVGDTDCTYFAFAR